MKGVKAYLYNDCRQEGLAIHNNHFNGNKPEASNLTCSQTKEKIQRWRTFVMR